MSAPWNPHEPCLVPPRISLYPLGYTWAVLAVSAEAVASQRQFPSDKVYRRDDRGIVGVEPLSAYGLPFFVIHTRVGRAALAYGS